MQEKLRQILSDMVTHIETIGGKDLKIDETILLIVDLFHPATMPMILLPVMGGPTTRIQAPEPESEMVFFPASEIKGTVTGNPNLSMSGQTMSEMVADIQKKECKPRKKVKRDKKKRIRILTEEELRIKRGEK